MLLYSLGKIVSLKQKHLILETNNQGIVLNICSKEGFKVSDNQVKIYIYEHKTEYMFRRYGFRTFKERVLFEDLLMLPGIGPRTSLAILSTNPEEVVTQISEGKYEKLADIPYVGLKTAQQIIISLQDKYRKIYKLNPKKINSDTTKTSYKSSSQELKTSLRSLGFKISQIDYALHEIPDFSLPHEQLVEQSIKIISSRNV